ncbi:OmpA family protein [Bacteroidales bacterium]|nr:OmpA family protein [Bacteroidales bacterium]
MKFFKILMTCLSLLMMSCVGPKVFKELDEQNMKCQEERDFLMAENENYKAKSNEFDSKIDGFKRNIKNYATDSVKADAEIRKLTGENNKLQNRYNELKSAQESLVRGNADETSRLLSELQNSQESLHLQEDKLRSLEKTLNERQANLKELTDELETRNERLIELENILSRKDSAVLQLKNKVTKALLGFENEGLQVNIKNGKVYVSLDEKLLFKTGSYNVDDRGAKALKKLGKVLEQNKDINVTIEGHTDDVPYNGSVILDNWDLSVHRATSIVRIIINNSNVDKSRFIVSGRGEYQPIDKSKTPEARRKNRRTEIILTPKLDELFQILDNY